VSGGNGSGPKHNGLPHNGNGAADPERRAFIQQIVREALEHGEELDKHEAGSSYGRICPPLLAGPQRYRDPGMWGPNYRLFASASSIPPEEIEAMQDTPLDKDERYKRIAELTYQRAVELGLPGTTDE
jgi:hypothetical protein